MYSRHPNKTIGLFYHELGHRVFSKNIAKFDSPLGKYTNLTNEVYDLASEGNKIYEMNSSLSEVEVEKLLDKWAKEVGYDKKVKALSEINNTQSGRLMDGLNELYSDVIAVAITEDPSIGKFLDSWNLS